MINKLNITSMYVQRTIENAHYTYTIGNTKSPRIVHQNFEDYSLIGTMQIYLLN